MFNLQRAVVALDKHLIDDWRTDALRFWSVRLALFWGALSGLFLVWPAFANVIPLWAFAGLSIVMSAALAVARLTKQPGMDDHG
jgi:hypothetical protein